MICDFCLSVAARTIVCADPSLRYTNKQPTYNNLLLSPWYISVLFPAHSPACDRLYGLVLTRPPYVRGCSGLVPRFHRLRHTSEVQTDEQLHSQTLGIVRSVQDWLAVRQFTVTEIASLEWQYVQLSEQIHLWDTRRASLGLYSTNTQ